MTVLTTTKRTALATPAHRTKLWDPNAGNLTNREKLEFRSGGKPVSWRDDDRPPTLAHQIANEAGSGEEQAALEEFYRTLIEGDVVRPALEHIE